ncbi:hypothetical protein EYF80_022443 [Liparis tanakae]|uniref:Uncharacterized protein n=1 Tax=Liparis tanakae TaxID=230148 RepID=A0A4Z2HNA5_9TELE|nr:hypothetical protein EYF80_022443 [Liparis tanakae]
MLSVSRGMGIQKSSGSSVGRIPLIFPLVTVEALEKTDGIEANLKSKGCPRLLTTQIAKEAYGNQHTRKPTTMRTTILVTSRSAFWVEADSAWAFAAC